MPFPILHAYAGYAVYKLTENKHKPFQWVVAFGAIFLANLADFDFVPGVLIHDAAKYHRLASHSFFAAFLCGLFFASLAVVFKWGSFKRAFIISSAAYASHLFLDLFSGSLAIFWPFTNKHFGLNHYFIGDSTEFLAATTIPGFIEGMFSTGCLVRMMKELMAVLFCFLITYIANSVSRQMPLKIKFIHNTVFGISLLYFSVYLWGNI